MCSKFRPFYAIGRVCVKTLKRMRIFASDLEMISRCDLHLLVIVGNLNPF